MKKIKLDPIKIIKIKPRMENKGPDVNLLLVLILGIILGLFLISCKNLNSPEHKIPKKLSKNSENYELYIREYTYESCEYIVVELGSSKWGSHKGNCKNPIHNK